MPRIASDRIGGGNIAAFLDMIAFSEGTSTIPESDDGYNVLVGGGLFHDYSDHPKQFIHINDHLTSSAAGRYQILAHIFSFYKHALGLKDFSPESQDLIAFRMIKECHAFGPIQDGQFEEAVHLCSSRWASLPGGTFGQRINSLPDLQSAYTKAGGVIA